MKNLTEYNNFVKLNKWNRITEEMDIDTGKAGSGTGQQGDMYFANVKGNLAGAENTLVGAAALKLFGFIKRKGLQVYMKRVLKPRLGRVYMNGILRYADTAGIGNFARKQNFDIKKIVDKKAIDVEEQVNFVMNQVNGLPAFKKGASVLVKTGESASGTTGGQPLEDGVYILEQNDATFTVADGKITNIKGAVDAPAKPEEEVAPTSQGQTDDAQSDDALEKYRKELEEKMKKMEAQGVSAEPDIIEECKSIRDAITAHKDSLDEDDIKSIKAQIQKINKSVTDMTTKGLAEIDKLLKKDDLKNRDEIRIDKLVYEANILEMLKLRKFLNNIITPKQPAQPVAEPAAQPAVVVKKEEVPVEAKTESHLYEADAPVVVKDKELEPGSKLTTPGRTIPKEVETTKLGDELAEIVKSGDAVDLNNEDFYKQFEDETHRKGVTNMVLRDKADIAKIQLTAERIIAGNAKQENAWKRMVENVKSMYSKYLITDLVDPYNVIKTASETDIAKWEKDNAKPGGEGAKLTNVKGEINADKNPNWNNVTQKLTLGKLNKNGLAISQLDFSKGSNNDINYYILENTMSNMSGMNFYRLLGTFDFDKVGNNSGTTFDNLVHKSYPELINPIMIDGRDKSGKGLRAVYVVYGSDKHLSTGAATNRVSLMYLFSEKGDIDFDQPETYVFKIKNFDSKTDYSLPATSAIDPKEPYIAKLGVYETSVRGITKPDSFIKFKKYDLTNKTAEKKMEGISSVLTPKK